MVRKKKRPPEPTAAAQAPAISRSEWPCVIVLATLACALLLTNLGNQYLWQDEAQTACVARTILTHGVPLGSDGVNSFSQEWGAEFGRNLLWRWHTWLPFYILALFLKLFGESTLVCRLPFALFGVGCVVMAYCLGAALWKSRRAGILSAVLLLLSVPLLTLVRECRPYSMAIFFSLWGLYAYLGTLEGRRRAPLWFVVASVLLFQSQYIYYASLLATVLVHCAIFNRDRLKVALIASAVSAIISLPWIVWLSGANFEGSLSYRFKPNFLAAAHQCQFVYFGRIYLALLERHICPRFLYPLPLLLLGVNFLRDRRFPHADAAMRNRVALVAIFVVVNVITITMLSPFPHFRYLATIIPALWLLVGLILDRLMKVHWIIGPAVLAMLFCIGTPRDYLYEITHDYDGPVEGTVTYLLANGNDGDVVVAAREEMPLKFYTKMKVIGGLSEEHPMPPSNPDWVVLRTVMLPTEQELASRVADTLDKTKYELITLDGYPDIPFENREEPYWHLFKTVKDERPAVKLLHRIAD